MREVGGVGRSKKNKVIVTDVVADDVSILISSSQTPGSVLSIEITNCNAIIISTINSIPFIFRNETARRPINAGDSNLLRVRKDYGNGGIFKRVRSDRIWIVID
ncbi:hypothetical protein AVEN_183258-1 [Araneus ventricosus]|uniref:Uncharacterized protein n=1 Tax=Araneus ventricosus TaxID=182803 RepID=A0A4Y2V6E7_ARAVE|nr:hypothetical protein AVEN_183258-1 [Araneus ventricosus]